MPIPPGLLDTLDREVDAGEDLLFQLADSLADDPEPGFAEYEAVARLTGALSAAGYAIEAPLAGLATAFRASIGSGTPTVAVFLEYDAHPEAGHLAGKHLSAAATIVALTALAAVAGALPGRIVAIGAPASEPDGLGAGGKDILLEAGALDDVDAAFLLVATNAHRPRLTASPAGRLVELRFLGKASHAASAPERGINALEGMLGTFALINALRQHLPIGSRIDGVVTNGGAAPNIVPESGAGRFWLRTPGPVSMGRVSHRLLRAAEASAGAAGASVQQEERSRTFLNIVDCPPLGEVVAEAWRRVHRTDPTGPAALPYPTDFGNVSQAIPSVLLPFRIGDAPPKTDRFVAELRSDAAGQAALDGARVLASATAGLLFSTASIAAGTTDLAARQERMRAFAASAGGF